MRDSASLHDIAKSFHVVSVIDETETLVTKKPFKIINDKDGFNKLIDKLNGISKNTKEFIIGLEAAGYNVPIKTNHLI